MARYTIECFYERTFDTLEEAEEAAGEIGPVYWGDDINGVPIVAYPRVLQLSETFHAA